MVVEILHWRLHATSGDSGTDVEYIKELQSRHQYPLFWEVNCLQQATVKGGGGKAKIIHGY
jgi:hypothetical protein